MHRRRLVPVERVDQPVDERRPHAGRALGEMVGETQRRGPDDIVRSRRALPDEMMGEHPRGVAGGVIRRDPDPLQDADAGRRAVDRRAAGHGRANDPDDLVQDEVAAGQQHGHRRDPDAEASRTDEPAGVAGGFIEMRLSETRGGRCP